MGVTDVITNSFSAVWKNPVLMVPYGVFYLFILLLIGLFVLTLHAPFAGVTGFSAMAHVFATLYPQLAAFIIFIFAISVLVTPLFVGMYVTAGVQMLKTGKVSLSSAFAAAKKRYLSILGASLLISLIIFIPALLFGIGFFLTGSPIFGLLIILLVIAAIIFLVLVYQWPAAVMIEGLGAVASVKRAIEIGKGRFWAILGLGILLVIIAFVVFLVGTIISTIFAIINPTLGTVVHYLIELLITAFFVPWGMATIAYFYSAYVKKVGK